MPNRSAPTALPWANPRKSQRCSRDIRRCEPSLRRWEVPRPLGHASRTARINKSVRTDPKHGSRLGLFPTREVLPSMIAAPEERRRRHELLPHVVATPLAHPLARRRREAVVAWSVARPHKRWAASRTGTGSPKSLATWRSSGRARRFAKAVDTERRFGAIHSCHEIRQ